MDDNKFDDRIKRKVGEFEDPDFDPSALAALHHQLGSALPWPWYAQYRTELMVGSGLVISTFIILLSLWFMNNNFSQAMNEKLSAFENQQAEIIKLQQEVLTLKSAPGDTVRIIEVYERSPSLHSSLLQRIRLLEAEIAKRDTLDRMSLAKTFDTVDNSHYLNEQYFAMKEVFPSPDFYSNPTVTMLKLSPRRTERKRPLSQPGTEAEQSSSQNLTAKTLRDLERHYQKGIGIYVGPTLEISRGFYKYGKGKVDVTAGVLTDFVLSPAVSVETGVKYVHRVYNVSDESDLLSMERPGADESLGTIQNVDIDSWIFEIPVNLKYRHPFSLKTHGLTGIGYSTIIYGSQLLEYEYGVVGNPSATLSSDYRAENVQVYPGMLNFSLGLSHQLKNKKTLETSIYYQLGLGEMGLDNNKSSFLGFRGVYWFNVR